LFGGSWGATLSLVYAETHPSRVLGMILRGTFLCRQKEIQWFYQDGANRIFPDYWKDFVHPIPQNERGDLLAAHHKRLIGNDEIARMASAKAWSAWEGRTATLTPRHRVMDYFTSPHVALALARIEAHYFMNNSFLEDNQILSDAGKIKDITGYIVHGRYDLICPLENAFALADVWPASQLAIIPNSGHSASEPAIVDALVQATIGMVSRLDD
jgi:proline iminopeptidase